MLVPDSAVALELVSTRPIRHPNIYSTPALGVCSDMEYDFQKQDEITVTRIRHGLPAWPVSCIVHDPNERGIGFVVRGTEMAPKICAELIRFGFAKGKPGVSSGSSR